VVRLAAELGGGEKVGGVGVVVEYRLSPGTNAGAAVGSSSVSSLSSEDTTASSKLLLSRALGLLAATLRRWLAAKDRAFRGPRREVRFSTRIGAASVAPGE
jgi:hypothetical protein